MYNDVIIYGQSNIKRKFFQVSEYDNKPINKKIPKKISKQRLKNIALYYLKRFESSVANLRQVLQRRTDEYAYYDKSFDKYEAYKWIEEILSDFERIKYLDDERYAQIKISGYLNAGKPARYIKIKLQQKGIDLNLINNILDEQTYNPFEMAMKFAKKKKIGPYRNDEYNRQENRQKDMATLIRAGFDYDIVNEVLTQDFINEDM